MRIMGKILFWAVLILSAVIFILPFWFMVCNSFEEFSYPYPAGARHSKVRSQVAEQPVRPLTNPSQRSFFIRKNE